MAMDKNITPNTTMIVDMIRRGELDPTKAFPFKLPTLSACLNEFMGQRGLSSDALAGLAGINRATVFKILGDKMKPSQEMLVSFALVLELSFEQTQTLLKCGNCSALSGMRQRDAIIIKGITEHQPLDDVDEALRALGLRGLIKHKDAAI